MSINQKSGRQTFRRRFVSGSLFVSPCPPECNFQSETKIEPDLRLRIAKLNEGIELIGQCQKLILIADKSDYGWKSVGEYLDNELADDDQDAKKRSSTENSGISRCQSREGSPLVQES